MHSYFWHQLLLLYMWLFLLVHPPAKFKSCKIVCTLCRVPRSEEVTGFVVDTGRKSSKRSVSVLEGGQDAFSNGVASGENIHILAFGTVDPATPALQMKGQRESNINVWFPLTYSQKLNCYFQNRIIMFCLPVPTLIYLWEIYIFSGSVCLFCCREICGPILGIYKWLTDTHMNVGIGTKAALFPEKE